MVFCFLFSVFTKWVIYSNFQNLNWNKIPFIVVTYMSLSVHIDIGFHPNSSTESIVLFLSIKKTVSWLLSMFNVHKRKIGKAVLPQRSKMSITKKIAMSLSGFVRKHDSILRVKFLLFDIILYDCVIDEDDKSNKNYDSITMKRNKRKDNWISYFSFVLLYDFLL